MSSTISSYSEKADYRRLLIMAKPDDTAPQEEFIPEELRRTIKELRLSKKLGQKAIAAVLRMERSNYTKIESGKVKNIKTEHLAKLAEFYKVDLHGLAYGHALNPTALPHDESRLLTAYREIKAKNKHRAPGMIDYLEFNLARIKRSDEELTT
jgi:transcriptional regulator with XRE-family HTH domain